MTLITLNRYHDYSGSVARDAISPLTIPADKIIWITGYEMYVFNKFDDVITTEMSRTDQINWVNEPVTHVKVGDKTFLVAESVQEVTAKAKRALAQQHPVINNPTFQFNMADILASQPVETITPSNAQPAAKKLGHGS